MFTDYVSGSSHDKAFSAVVRNLVIQEPDITQTVASDVIEQLGAVAAYAVNTTFYNIRVEGGRISGISGAAAIAGRAGSVVIDSCSSDAEIYTSMHRAAGIVGAVYMDGTSELRDGAGLPLYLTDCTFSGTLTGTVTSGQGNFGGILGTSYLGPGLYLRDNTVNGTIGSLTAGTTATVYVTDGSADVNVATGSGDISIVDQTTAAGPSVNAATAGGDVEVSRADGDTVTDIYTKVNLTVTDGLGAGQTLFIRGQFASVVHHGAGDVIMESADTAVTNVVLKGEVLAFGSAGTVIKPGDSTTDTSCMLSLVPASVNTLEVYLLTTDGTALSSGSLALTAVGGTFTAESGAVAGGGASEKVGTVTVDTASAQTVTVTVSGSFTPAGGEAVTLTDAACEVTIPAAIERVDTVLLTSEEEFNTAKAQYDWDDVVTAPTEYPVLAVMPVVNESYSGVEVKVNDAVVSNGVSLVAVDKDTVLAAGSVTVTVTASGTGVPTYSENVTYTLTEADGAKLDTENAYYYVTFRYMDGKTADGIVPVVQGESLVLPAAVDRAGYTFLGWSDGSATHTAGTSFMDGDTVTLKAIRGSGYSFSSWTVGDTKTYEDTVTVTMDSNQTVTAEFYAVSSGGSTSVSAYGITVGSVANGTIKVTPARAAKGATVTITATPDAGYELSSIQVETVSGSTVTVTKDSAGKYTFTMPAQAVRIIAAFSEVQEVTNPFTDVAESAWYYKAVKYVYEQGMMAGTNDGTTFSPTMELTRGMMAQVLYNIEQGSAPAGSAFTDVVSGAWYADAVNWAAANGIVGGWSRWRSSCSTTPTSKATTWPLPPICPPSLTALMYPIGRSTPCSGQWQRV